MQDMLQRLINGFSPFGYSLLENDEDCGIYFEFRKPETALRFAIRGAEGGVILFWTESDAYDLKIRGPLPVGVKAAGFSDRESFWKTVRDAIAGTR